MRIRKSFLKAGTNIIPEAMSKIRQLYKYQYSSTNNANMLAPLNGTAGTLVLNRPARIKSIKMYVTCFARDSENADWNMEVLGKFAIQAGGGLYANNGAVTPLWYESIIKNAGTDVLDIPLPAGTYSTAAYIYPLITRAIGDDATGIARLWSHCTTSLTVLIETEED